MSSTLARLVLQKFDETKVIDQLTKWGGGGDISEYERVALESLPELLKTTWSIMRSSGAMYRWLCLQIDDDVSASEDDACELLPHGDFDSERLYRKLARLRWRTGAYGSLRILQPKWQIRRQMEERSV